MLRKRIIGMIAVADGRAVQSFGYRRYLPLGTAQCLAENLDRWNVDEIVIVALDRSRRGLGPDFRLVEQLAGLGLSTPLAYGGGIRNATDAVDVTRAGAERVCIDAVLHDSPAVVPSIAEKVGAQALIAALPLSRRSDELEWYDHRTRKTSRLDPAVTTLLRDGHVAEALIVDWQHEGEREGFDLGLIDASARALAGVPLLAYGGVSEPHQMQTLLQHRAVAAVAIGNFLNYRELAVQKLKQRLATSPVRAAAFARSR